MGPAALGWYLARPRQKTKVPRAYIRLHQTRQEQNQRLTSKNHDRLACIHKESGGVRRLLVDRDPAGGDPEAPVAWEACGLWDAATEGSAGGKRGRKLAHRGQHPIHAKKPPWMASASAHTVVPGFTACCGKGPTERCAEVLPSGTTVNMASRGLHNALAPPCRKLCSTHTKPT